MKALAEYRQRLARAKERYEARLERIRDGGAEPTIREEEEEEERREDELEHEAT